MSADPTSRKPTKSNFNGHVVLPQPVSDPSIIESVAGFIHEVVPQAYSSVLPGESRDQQIVWARFETCDYNDPENYPQVAEIESDTTPPLLLVLGYGTGAQVWTVPGSGDATEVFTWSLGTVKTLRLIHCPRDASDPFASKRPLVAIVDSAGPGPQYCTVNFVSLKTGEVIKSIKFKTPVVDVLCNKRSIVITFVEKIAVFDTATLEDRVTITTCYPSPGICQNPVALGQRWLAYAEKQLTTWNRSSGGCEGDGAQSYTATAIHAVKSLGKGLRDLSGSLTGNVPPPSNNNSAQPGIVTVMDIETKASTEEDTDNIVAHFVAHVGPVVAMSFDASGMLLVTADKHGHRFHVFRIHPHPVASQLASVHHLYILHRGETTARVQDIAISRDSRWVAVSSVRGTTHVFPITPYGGPVTVRTHTTPNVVNRLSRFERSAGLSDGRGSPLLEAPSQPLTPRLPPYPHPNTLNPLAQLRKTPLSEESPLAAVFAAPRAWLPGRSRGRRSIVESLFVISSAGTLIQYDLDPRCIPGIPKDKISYDTGIELGVEAKAEWCLMKPPYSSNMQPPLPLSNPLLTFGKFPSSEPTPPSDDRWLSQVEIITHTGPHRRLWMGPQFNFKPVDPLPTGAEEESEAGVGSLARSNPVNIAGHRPYLLIDGGSSGSMDTPHLTGYSSSTEDIVHGESRLREDLADAMLESSAPHNTCVLGGGKMRAALLERQVNPLGTVITLPVDGSIPPPLQFILPAQVLHPSLDRPSTSRAVPIREQSHYDQQQIPHIQQQVPPIDYLNLALPCVSCVVNPVESGSPPYVPALSEPELPDPFLEVMKDAGIPQISQTSSKAIKTEAKPKSKGKRKKSSVDRPKDRMSPVKDPVPLPQPAQEPKDDVRPVIPKPRACRGKSAEDSVQSLPVVSIQQSTDEVSELPVAPLPDLPNEETALVPSDDLLTADASIDLIREDPIETAYELDSSPPLVASVLSPGLDDGIVYMVRSNLPETEFQAQTEEAAALELSQPEYLIDLPLENIEPADVMSVPSFDQDPEEAPGDSESNSEPLTAVNVSRDDSINDIRAETTEIEEDVGEANLGTVDVENSSLFCSPEQVEVYPKKHKDAKKIKGGKSKGKRKEKADEIKELEVDDDDAKPGADLFDEPMMSSVSLLDEPLLQFTDDFPELEAPSAQSRPEVLEVLIEPDLGEKLERRRQSRRKASLEKQGSQDDKIGVDSSSETMDTGESQSVKESSNTSNHESSQSDVDLIELKRGRRERLKKLKSAESLEEVKKKSPSPSKSEIKLETDSSDEAIEKNVEKPILTSKTVKRKKGKKNEELESPTDHVKLKGKSKSEGTLDEKSDYETCSEKKSDSSIESFTDTKKKQDPNGNFGAFEPKSWSSVVKNTREPLKATNSAEDRDSVYESCNDEVPENDVADVTFESSKEDFEETKPEGSSDAAEEKTDSGDKEVAPTTATKKVRKQKKKRR